MYWAGGLTCELFSNQHVSGTLTPPLGALVPVARGLSRDGGLSCPFFSNQHVSGALTPPLGRFVPVAGGHLSRAGDPLPDFIRAPSGRRSTFFYLNLHMSSSGAKMRL